MTAAYASIALLAAITLVLAFIAIRRSAKRVQTTFYIVAAISACGVLGAVIGLARVNSNIAGFVAYFLMEVVGFAVLELIAIRRKPRKLQTGFYIVTVILAGGLVGSVIRLAFVNSHAAGILGTLFMLAGGIAVSIEQIRKHRNVGLT